MTNSNSFLWMAVGLVLLGAVYLQKTQIVESFGMIPPQTIRVEQIHGEANPPMKGDMFMIPGTFQATLPPRQAGMVDYGPNLRYNMPDQSKRADTMGSLYTNVVNESYNESYNENYRGPKKEDYCGSCTGSVEGFQANPSQMPPPAMDLLPSQSMGSTATNALGEETQPIIYDRFIFANQKDRLREGADFIRGDLPIVPMSKGWFTPSATPQTALRTGALEMIGGTMNETSKELQALKSAAIAGVRPPAQASAMFGGGSQIPSYSIQSNMNTSAAGGDIQVTRFP